MHGSQTYFDSDRVCLPFQPHKIYSDLLFGRMTEGRFGVQHQ